MATPRSSSDFRASRVTQTSTPSLLNEVYTRLRASASGLEHACGQAGVSGLHVWMNSYGARLGSMADLLQDEGAKTRAGFGNSADRLFLKETCESPEVLLREIERIQERILQTYAQLSMRLDMDEDLYEMLLDQQNELKEVATDIQELRMEYEAYGSVDA